LVLSIAAAWLLDGPGLPRYFQVPTPLDAAQRTVDRLKTAGGILQSAEAPYRALFTFVNDAIFVADAETGMIVDANPMAEALIGRPLDEIRMLHHTELYPSDGAELVCRGFAEHVREPAIAESTLQRRDGRQIPVEVVTTVWTDPNEKTLIIGLFRDISVRKRTAEALRDIEQFLASIYNTVGDVIFHLAVEPGGRFRFLSVNAAFLRSTGLSLEAVVGKTVNEVIPEPSLTRVLGKYRQAIEENTIVHWEETSDYPSGRITGKVSVAPVFDHKGTCTHLIGSVHDVTERKRAEAALRESELFYREVFDSFSECVFVLDVMPEGRFRIMGFNPAEERATGLSNAEVAGKFIDDVLPEDTAQRVIAHYRRCVEVGTIINYDEELNLPIGARYFHTNLIPLRNQTGRIHRIVGCCLDFTDLKRSQEEALARQKLESIGTLASGIAHDFNNLLGAVLAQADLALAELAAGSHPEEELQRIRDVAIHGAEIVRQLMIYAGKESESLELIDVSRIIQQMVDLFKVAVSKHAALEIDLAKDLPAVRANAALLRQIVVNLVTNASEAIGDRDGVIRVATEHVAIDRAAATSKGVSEGVYVQLEISDTGPGMSPETQARMFDPFFTTKSTGRGLGLAVVQGCVRKLGGAIHFASEPGKGTTFQILLPLEAGAEATAGPIPQAEEVLQPSLKATVLVVEDEDPLRQAIAKMLRKRGFEVLEAANGSTAIDLLRAHSERVDTILLDMTIPGHSSGEVLDEASRARPDLKVILTSAYSEETVMATMSSPLIRRFIRKPFHLGDLLQTFRSVLSS